MDSKVGPLIVKLINRIIENAEIKYDSSSRKAKLPYSFLEMDISRWIYFKGKKEYSKKKLDTNIDNWRFYDYQIQFTKTGAKILKQGINSGFSK